MRLKDNGDSLTLWISADETYWWARRPGNAWPCSELSGKRLCASYDRNGLCDLTVNGRDGFDGDVHELNTIVADHLAERIGEDHALWFVTVGQFR